MSFLDHLTAEQVLNAPFPLQEVLHNSLYYPSCGFDGGVVKDCNTVGRDFGIRSFIYCDYATGEAALLNQQNTFLGYHVVARRQVTHSELIPNGWRPQFPPNFNLEAYRRFRNAWKPFINWIIYERDEKRGEEHGPKRFSLLYLGGEGVATYQALYWTNNSAPKALAIIQPGTGFGLNWTDFEDKQGALSWVVNNNSTGSPTLLYHGGVGQGYGHIDWDNYTFERSISPYYSQGGGEVNLYRKSNH